MWGKNRIVIPPVKTTVDGAEVDILEVIKLPPTGYHVTVRVRLGDFTSRVFFIDALNEKDFERKLAIEISKLKTMLITRGLEFTKEVMGA